jgi:hypothetical protein
VPEATFKNKAHLVPAGVGNRTLLASEECDGCNSMFGDSGDREIVELLAPFRTLLGVKGRRRVGTFKDRTGSEIRSKSVNVLAASSTTTAKEVNRGFGYFDVEVTGRVDFYKISQALARMALHVVSRNGGGYGPALDLARGTSNVVPSLAWVHYAGVSTRDGYLRVLREPDWSRGHYLVELMACSLGLFLPLPAGSWTLRDDMTRREILGYGTGEARHANVGSMERAEPGSNDFSAYLRFLDPSIHEDPRGPASEPRMPRRAP